MRGYEFGRWTGERLATYLAQKTGIQLTGTQVRRILKKSMLTCGRGVAGQNTLAGVPAQQNTA